MTEYTTPITTTFEMQRQAIKQGQQAFEQSIEFQQTVSEAFVDSLDSQESAQRRTVELSKTAFHGYLDAVESTVPGAAGSVEEIRGAIDEQFEFLLENHAELFENIEAETRDGLDAYEDLTTDYLDAMDEQIEMVMEAHEDLEGQSIEAAEQVEDQLEQMQDQVEQVQDQVQEVQEQAAEQLEA
jgi:ABC-type transporter Mla subunit MlaD